jgi:general secretion pathway protein G
MTSRCDAVEPNAAQAADTEPRFSQTRREAGFTLIELLVVLAILGLLISVVAPQVIRYLGRAKVSTASYEVKNIGTALDLFMIDVGRYPTQEEGLGALVANPGIPRWEGPYLKAKGVPVDAWGHPYQYRIPGTDGRDYDLYSLGPDGTGTASSSP